MKIEEVRKNTLVHLDGVKQKCRPEHQHLVASAMTVLSTCPIESHPLCSFTFNKETIYLKTRDPTGQPYAECLLVKVLIHELTHMILKEYGHDANFWRVFAILYQSNTECPVPMDYECPV